MKRPRSAANDSSPSSAGAFWSRPATLTALAATALVTSLSGCASPNSPSIITTPYQAADGTNYAIPESGLKLANFLVVGIKKGEPASVVGNVINEGTTAVELKLSTAADATGGGTPTAATLTVPAGTSAQIGPAQDTSLTLPELSVEPGARLTLNAVTSTSGTSVFTVPVVRSTGYYESLTPSPTPSPTPSRNRRAGSDGGASSSATPEPTASPTS